jgi:hypothetical protein
MLGLKGASRHSAKAPYLGVDRAGSDACGWWNGGWGLNERPGT